VRRRTSATAPLLLLAFGIAPLSAAGPTLQERRQHRAYAAPASLPAGLSKAEQVVLGGRIAGSSITRWWLTAPPQPGKLSAQGIERQESVLLFELEGPKLRFLWRDEHVFSRGESSKELVIWYSVDSKESIKLKVRGFTTGKNLAEFVSAAITRASQGKERSDDELLIEVSLAGRTLPVSLAEWQSGLTGEAKEWLDSAISERLRAALTSIAALALREPDSLEPLCSFVLKPVLGDSIGTCDANLDGAHPFFDERDTSNCRFDASFGEGCSLSQTLREKTRDNPTL